MTRPVPAGLAWWRTRPGGAAWLARLPRLVDECAERWRLRVGAPFAPGTISYVAPVVLEDGTRAVLKVSFPEAESEHEADALALWAGAGAVRLLAADRARRALLVERCDPGTPLWHVADEDLAYAHAAGVLRALWRPLPAGHPFRALATEAQRWAAELPARWERHGRPVERAVLERAVGWVGELLAPPEPSVVVHQDLHGGNVLRATRAPHPSTAAPGSAPLRGEPGGPSPSTAAPGSASLWGEPGGPWLAIDPKPLAGERAFDVASLLRDRRVELAADAAPVRRVRRRLDQLSAELGLDRERARRWGVVHALAWGMDDDEAFPDILACAEWLARA